MINKKLLSFDRKALRYVGLNVLFQWLGMLCNVVLVMTVSRLIGSVFAGSLTGNALWQGMLLCLLTVPVRYGLTLCASDMSDRASKDVKRTLRSSIYAKLTRLGAGYSETVATSEAVMLASEGVEQIDTYFAKYLPQLFYSLLAGDAALPADCAGALWPYPLRLRYERPGFQGCQAHPAQQHLCKAHPAGGRLQRDGGHQ